MVRQLLKNINNKVTARNIVVVDDDMAQRMLLKMCLEEQNYKVHEADSGNSALKLLNDNFDFRIVITDLDMPDVNGFELIEAIRSSELRYTYIIVLTSLEDEDSLVKALSLGADDYLAKPVNPNELKLRVQGGLRILKQESQEELILALAKLAEYRSDETGYHLERVQHYTRLLASDLMGHHPELGLTAQTVEDLARVSPLHDIGKVAIPDSILHKPAKLTEAEYTIMKTHAEIGGKLLKDVYRKDGSLFLKIAYELTMYHHERFDGSGYPHGLQGTAIPLPARIMTLTDIYDAMTSKRCYKEPFPHEEVKSIILAEQGKQLDPMIVAAFIRLEKQWLAIKDQYQELQK